MPRVYPPIEAKPKDSSLPSSFIESTAGFTAGTISTLVVHPFDVIKTRLQGDLVGGCYKIFTHAPPVSYNDKPHVGGSMQIVRDIVRNEGAVQGLYRGLTPNIIGNSVSWGLYFLWYGNIKDIAQSMRGADEKLKAIDYFAASGISGILTAFFTNPIWVIKTRMLSTARNAPGAYNTTWQGASSIWHEEGVKGFYRGLVPSLFGVTHGAIQFSAYEKLKIYRASIITGESTKDIAAGNSGVGVRHELGNWDFLVLSAISKIFAGSITYPYQVVRARLQMYDARTRYTGATDVVRQIWAREGAAGFYKGLGPNIVRVLPSTCVTFLVYENMKIYLPQFWAREQAERAQKATDK